MKRWLPLYGLLFAVSLFAEDKIALPERGVCAHRGDHSVCPENTVPAFESAVKRNVEMIEMDVKYTQDRKMVILHDPTVDRTSNGTGKLSDLTFDEVRTLDFGIQRGKAFQGTKIPTLDEALAVIPKNIWINLHTQGPAELGLEVAETILRTGREHQAFIACGRPMQEAIRARYPQILLCNMQREYPGKTYPQTTLEWGCPFLQLTSPVTPEEMQSLHKAGVKINYFHAETAEMAKKRFDAGVDFVLTDHLTELGK